MQKPSDGGGGGRPCERHTVQTVHTGLRAPNQIPFAPQFPSARTGGRRDSSGFGLSANPFGLPDARNAHDRRRVQVCACACVCVCGLCSKIRGDTGLLEELDVM